MKNHYHVIAGFHGCLPESNDLYTSKRQARSGLREIVKQLRESGNKLEGTIKSGYFEITHKEDALGDYVEIGTCQESECLKEIEE